jgi:superfamily I DNA/RNA helicase
MEISAYQQAVLDAVTGTSDNLLIQACAGAGKTTTLQLICQVIRQTWPGATVLCVAFNKPIADEMARRLPPGVAVSTLHAHGFAAVRKVVPGVQKDEGKLRRLAGVVAGPDNPRVMFDLMKLAPLVMATMVDPQDPAAVQASAQRVGLDCDDLGVAVGRLPDLLMAMLGERGAITYDEMIFHPLMLDYPVPKFDFVLVDETQDLNESQQDLVAASVKATGRIIATGDRWQSVYGFRGADPEAMERMQTRFSMRELRLPVTWRCPTGIVALAQALAGADIITAAPGAAPGLVIHRRHHERDQTWAAVRPGDMVLCRVNAPLISNALGLIAKGVKAVVRGRDFGTELLKLVERFKMTSLTALAVRLAQWRMREQAKALAEENTARMMQVQDRHDCLVTLMDACETDEVSELCQRIDTVFDDQAPGVVFSTIHKAKGLEARHVVLLGPEMIPHPMARRSPNPVQAIRQEMNIKYVAFTRAMDILTLQELPPKRS